MDAQATNEKVETNGGEGVVLEKTENEGDADEDHDMNIVEQGTHRIPACLKTRFLTADMLF